MKIETKIDRAFAATFSEKAFTVALPSWVTRDDAWRTSKGFVVMHGPAGGTVLGTYQGDAADTMHDAIKVLALSGTII